jgi:ATP-dependent DNA helicase RecG
MPSALETLVKILKLEQDTGYQDKAVIGGLRSFAAHWTNDAHAQAKKPEHHVLVDELAELLTAYGNLPATTERHEAIKFMLGRITGRIPPVGGAPKAPYVPPTAPAPASAPPENREPRENRDNRDYRDNRDNRAPARSSEPAAARPPAPPPVRETPPARVEPPAPPHKDPPPRVEPTYTPRKLDPAPAELATDEFDDVGESEPIREEHVSVAPSQPAKLTHPPRRKRGQRDSQREAEVLRILKASVSNLNGVGPKIAEKLEQIGIFTLEDMLYCFPRRYDDYTRMVPLAKLRPGQLVTVIGTVRNATVVKGKRGVDVLKITIDDGTGVLTASFFGQAYLRSKMERGTQVVFSGKTDLFLGQITLSNPEWELLEREALHTRAIVPVYPLTKGLSAHNMRKFTRTAVDQWTSQLPDYMPEYVLERTDLAELGWSIQQMHFPSSWDALEHAKRRLAFDELMILQLGVLRNRRDWQSVPSESITVSDEILDAFIASLPYPLTGAQTRSIQAIRADIARTIPMNRLLQGDVGAGKTVVAASAMAAAVAGGFQAALMAPTSILAEQHYRSISRMLANSPNGEQFNVQLLTGSTTTQERNDILWWLGEGTTNILIGTHALLENDVNFKRLGLVVIDEQHRFGVEQRARLRGKGVNPHVLIMTATPIPRTLALTLYADLDLTILDEMPPGRTPIDTRVLQPRERERAYSFIESQLVKERQAFIVYPLVEQSESETMSEVRSAVEEFERLQKEVFRNRKLGLLHGRLNPSEKDEVMSAFSRGELDILVSTAVVEVGIDVPNASVMLIDGANRFGLAQLHQFRGRVGRGEHASFCLLIPDNDDTENERLKAMESTTDGFKLAEIDWEMRGAGELLGTRQSGGTARYTDHMDIRTVEEAQVEARTIYEEDPDMNLPEHAGLREQLQIRFGVRSHTDVS